MWHTGHCRCHTLICYLRLWVFKCLTLTTKKHNKKISGNAWFRFRHWQWCYYKGKILLLFKKKHLNILLGIRESAAAQRWPIHQYLKVLGWSQRRRQSVFCAIYRFFHQGIWTFREHTTWAVFYLGICIWTHYLLTTNTDTLPEPGEGFFLTGLALESFTTLAALICCTSPHPPIFWRSRLVLVKYQNPAVPHPKREISDPRRTVLITSTPLPCFNTTTHQIWILNLFLNNKTSPFGNILGDITNVFVRLYLCIWVFVFVCF